MKSNSETSQRSNTSKLRWKILSSALKGQVANRNQASIRRFSSFGLFDRREVDNRSDQAISHDEIVDTIESINGSPIQSNQANEQTSQLDEQSDQKSIQTKRIKVSDQIEQHCETSPPKNQTDQLTDDKWFYYSLNSSEINFQIKLKFTSNKIPFKELFHCFDNTGNYLWLSEEILAYFCLKNSFLFDNLNVCELGCGLSAFAGLTVALSSKANYVLLTDGNTRCIKNVEIIRKANQSSFNETIVQCKQLKWRLMDGSDDESIDKSADESDKSTIENSTDFSDDAHDKSTDEYDKSLDDSLLAYHSLKSKFDVILCSDCLYFEKSHLHLIQTIFSLLNENGIAIIMAPLRKNSFGDFMKLSFKYFHLKVHIVYDEMVWRLDRKFQKELADVYQTDQCYPLMGILQKRRNILL